MKKLTALCAALLLVMSCVIPAAAAENGQRVYDQAGLLSDNERASLEDMIAQAVDRTGLDIAVVTTNSKDGKTRVEYADDFYDEHGFGIGDEKSGLLFLIDMEDRRVYMSTTGDAAKYFTDSRIYDMTDGDDTLFDHLAYGEYKLAAERFLERVLYYHGLGIEADQHYVYADAPAQPGQKSISLFELIVAAFIPGVIGFSVVRNIRNQYGMKKEKVQASNYRFAYRGTAAFAYGMLGDELLSRDVTRHRRPIVQVEKGPGHSGGSTIHMGGSGTFHGGGGGGRSF